ncbi:MULTISPECIES: XkdF-like putative serine protease domain-containing protein [Sphingobacterium]|uniref:XkdF-like putative serine protease domain-containing protein n=1 Tax=Sphingobacterium TaxID=28453 RepID=UPI0013DC3E6B|nr:MULTISPECIES: XkdF-like putative serine protease domain-containing protein [unclassified Sphingobacterium]
MDKKEVIELKINPDLGLDVNVISIVDDPAVESNFIAFSKLKEPVRQTFNFEKMELLGVAMKPDVLIPREGGKEVFFSKETIRTASINYFKQGYQTKINLQHSNTFITATVFQSFITDSKLGVKAPEAFGELPEGTWIVGLALDKTAPESAKVWELIKNNVFKGFSIEGYFIEQYEKMNKVTEDTLLNAYKELEIELDGIIEKYNIK